MKESGLKISKTHYIGTAQQKIKQFVAKSM